MNTNRLPGRGRRVALGTTLAIAGIAYLVGTLTRPLLPVRAAEILEGPPTPTVAPPDARSEAVLRDILVLLQQMDRRVERIETGLLTAIDNLPPAPAVPTDSTPRFDRGASLPSISPAPGVPRPNGQPLPLPLPGAR